MMIIGFYAFCGLYNNVCNLNIDFDYLWISFGTENIRGMNSALYLGPQRSGEPLLSPLCMIRAMNTEQDFRFIFVSPG